MQTAIDTERLARVTNLASGDHLDESAMCAMEAAAYIAGEPWSDHPECVCPVLGAFMRSWNDGLPSDAERNRLLLPLIPRLIGTRGSPALEQRRATMAADWLVRVHTPAWLRLAKLDTQAAALEALPEVVDFAKCQPLIPALEAARSASAAARAAASAAARAAALDAAWAAARAAAGDAALDAAWAAASAAAWDAAGDAAWAAAWDAASAAAWDAAWAAAWAAAWDAAGDAASETQSRLQISASDLVNRMIDAKPD